VVVEANRRVGGRVVSKTILGGEHSERGGTFTGPTQDRIQALARELGVGTFNTFNSGNNLYIAGGSRLTYSDTGLTGTAPPDPVILLDLATAVQKLNGMAAGLDVNAPWNSPRAAEWDGITLESWIKANTLTGKFRELTATATRPIFGTEPREMSLLFVLHYIAASGTEGTVGTFERNFNTRAGAQEKRFTGGSQLIPERMARQLGRRVVLRSPVRRIVQERGRVTVESDRVNVRAKRAIVAIPPTLAGRIDYRPILPFERDQLTQRYFQGTMTKVTAVYDRPFWRDQGLNGSVITLGGPVSVTFDDSPPSGRPGVVFGFVAGDEARRFHRLSAADRRAAVLRQFAEFFGPAGARPREYFETNWSAERWTRGCPTGMPAPGALYAYGPWIRRPIGRIHWAGTETSGYWNGYMDGAVRSGERAAREVLAEI
jgi:monoamine oxidase